MMKKLLLMMCFSLLVTGVIANATVITGNHTASFNKWDGDSGAILEDGFSGCSPIIKQQSISVPDDLAAGEVYQAESLTATYKRTWDSAGQAGTVHIYIMPGKITNGQTFSDDLADALGHGSFNPESLTYDEFVTLTVNFDSPFQISAGDYHIEWRMEGLGSDRNQKLRIARDNYQDTYMSGQGYDEGYRNCGDWSVSNGRDLFFDLNGSVIPEPATIGLLLLGIAGIVRRRK